MRSYLLLRDNQQSGPYSREELASMNLRSVDLVWEEGESKEWKYPTEVDELKNFVDISKNSSHPAGRTGGRTQRSQTHSVAAPGRTERDFTNASYAIPLSGSYNEIKYQQSIEELKNLYAERWRKRKLWTRKLMPGTNLLTLFVVIGGVFISAFLVKKGVDNFDIPITQDEAPTTTTQLQTIQIPVNGKVTEYKIIPVASKETKTKKR
jgi:hypothetical protein